MNKLLEQNNYVVIDNFLDKSYVNELHTIIHNDAKLYPEFFSKADEQCPNTKTILNYRWFLEILVNKTLALSEFMEESLFPTYCYSRIYNKGDVLKKHIDRPACEISVTTHIGSDGTPWEIYFTKPNNDIVSVNLEPGQAVVYLGMQSAHWREEFKGQHYTQLFLHYVRSRGPYWDRYFDLNPNKFGV